MSAVLPAATPPNLAETVARRIRAEIVDNRLQPGDALAGELEMARRFGVSRGIVREGRRQLVEAGLIAVTNGRPARVRALDDAPLDGLFRHAIATGQLGVHQVLRFRRVLEIGMAGEAAAARTAEDLATLDAIVSRQRAWVGVRGQYLLTDMQFHQALARATHNPMFSLLLDAIEEPMGASMRASEERRATARQLREVHRHHEAIYDAVVRGDRAAAEQTMRAHFAEIQDTLDCAGTGT